MVDLLAERENAIMAAKFSYDAREHSNEFSSDYGDYAFYSTNDGFHKLQVKHLRDSEISKGSKLHISVAPEDLKKAWDIIWKQVIKSKVGLAKIVNQTVAKEFDSSQNPQRGKMITLYDDGRDADEWQGIAQKIEMQFAKEKIKPGFDVNHDKPVAGSQYFSHRNERDINEKYVPAEEASKINPQNPHNPYDQDDPFDIVDVSSVYTDSDLTPVPKPNLPETVSHSHVSLKSEASQYSQEELELIFSADPDVDELLTKIMAIPFENDVKDGQPVLRADMYSMSSEELQQAQAYLEVVGIKSEIGASSLYKKGVALKVDEGTENFQKLQNVYIARMARKEILKFGITNENTAKPNATRIDMDGIRENPDGMKALVHTLRRIHTAPPFAVGNSSLFPDAPENSILKLDDCNLTENLIKISTTIPVPLQNSPAVSQPCLPDSLRSTSSPKI